MGSAMAAVLFRAFAAIPFCLCFPLIYVVFPFQQSSAGLSEGMGCEGISVGFLSPFEGHHCQGLSWKVLNQNMWVLPDNSLPKMQRDIGHKFMCIVHEYVMIVLYVNVSICMHLYLFMSSCVFCLSACMHMSLCVSMCVKLSLSVCISVCLFMCGRTSVYM